MDGFIVIALEKLNKNSVLLPNIKQLLEGKNAEN